MKEFNLILDKVSQALNMTVDNVVKLYPQLRNEYSWYYVLDKINDISGNSLFVLGGLLLFAIAYIFIDGCTMNEYKTYVKIAICIWVLMAIINVISFVLQGFMCPDILIIKEFLK
ncbi:MAG: hypothetical protein K6F12_05290 [Streptococcus sp.]|uniref:hypothetical protein n=1 Tax=Streptococcus sp. TaxID=1306 RepID=UPI002587748B|nr:hypothetical protein [Streptococcus sp.]MCR5493063.1 hypothetical protein [Streptococcus sp.]